MGLEEKERDGENPGEVLEMGIGGFEEGGGISRKGRAPERSVGS